MNVRNLKGRLKLDSGQFLGYALWKQSDGFHLRWTTKGRKACTFQGKIVCQKKLKIYRKIRLGTEDIINEIENNVIEWQTTLKKKVVGLNFLTPGNFTLELRINNKKIKPKKIFLGLEMIHPKKNPFTIIHVIYEDKLQTWQKFEPEPTYEPISEPEPVYEPTPEPKPIYEPTTEPESEPEPEPEPIYEPTTEPESEPESVYKYTPEPDSVYEPILEPESEPELVYKYTPEPEPVYEPIPKSEPEPEPVYEPTQEPKPELEPAYEPMHEPSPIHEPTPEPEPVYEPIAEPQQGSIYEPTPEPEPKITIEPTLKPESKKEKNEKELEIN